MVKSKKVLTLFVSLCLVLGVFARAEAREERNTELNEGGEHRINVRTERVREIDTKSRERWQGQEVVSEEVIVKFKGENRAKRIKMSGERLERMLERYKNREDVEYVEPNYIAHAFEVPNDPYYVYQWNFDNSVFGGIGMEEAWNVSKGSGAVVAVVDTGIAYENYSVYKKAPDLANTCFVPGYDFVNNDTHPNDDESHGTHVAGTIAQSTNNGVGVAGIAYKACLMPVKVLDRFGSGSYADVADGIIWAVDHGADVVNLSLGGSASAQIIEDAVKYAYENGVTVVAASGNENAAVSYPAAYDNYVIAVGATRYDETRAPYSNHGSSLDVVAPGGDLSVNQNGDPYGDGILQNTFNPNTKNPSSFGYWFFEGTSMATPHVSGVAALVISNGNATTPNQVREAIQSTAEDKGAAGWDEYYGWGLVNAFAALSWNAPPPPPPGNQPPIAQAGADQTKNDSDNNGTESVTLNGSASSDPDGTIVSYEWKEGNTVLGTGSVVTQGMAVGVHTITLTVTDNGGAIDTDDVVVTVNANQAPTANAGPDQAGVVGQTMNMNGSASADPDGTIVSYEWDFGDGGTGTGVSPSHVYASAGVYTTTLTVTDNGSATHSDAAAITIGVPGSEVEVFNDSFEVSEWNGLWTEDSQNDWFRSGQRAINGSRSAEVDGFANNAQLISVPINLQGKTNAQITFSWFIEPSLDIGEYLAFDVSTNGGVNWTEKGRLRGDVDQENVWHNQIVEVSGISSLRIRFRGSMSSSNEDADVDNVKVMAW